MIEVQRQFSPHDTVDNKDKDVPRSPFMSQEPRKPANISSPPPSPAQSQATAATTTTTQNSLHKEENRLETFVNWNVPFIDKRQLARTGFYFIGPNDVVKCFFCTVEIGCWEPDDNPIDEHLKWAPNCPLMRGRETSNDPIDADELKRILPTVSYDTCGIRELHASAYVESRVSPPLSPPIGHQAEMAIHRPEHPEFQIEANRFASYEDWPNSLKQKPKELAEAGFYYTGKGDRVVCFSCGGGLKHWEESDKPWEQHAMWYSKCEYLKLVKGQKYIDEILARRTTPPSSFSESHDEGVQKTPQNSQETLSQCSSSEDTSSKPQDENKLCRVCYQNEFNTIFIPCGHILTCAKCATSVTKCPLCRQPFTQVMRYYMPT